MYIQYRGPSARSNDLKCAERLSVAQTSLAIEMQIVSKPEEDGEWPKPYMVTPLPPDVHEMAAASGDGDSDCGDGNEDTCNAKGVPLNALREPTSLRPHFSSDKLKDLETLGRVGDPELKKAHRVNRHVTWGTFGDQGGVGGVSFTNFHLSTEHPLHDSSGKLFKNAVDVLGADCVSTWDREKTLEEARKRYPLQMATAGNGHAISIPANQSINQSLQFILPT